MAVSLEKFTEVATVGNGRKRHALWASGWSYVGATLTRCSEVATAREYRQSGRPVPMNCGRCARAAVSRD